ncbi:hypothetical protein BJF93_14240 [Xaviernesmea oryzae]|uniref:DUF1214 domain-containing protein n=1 Tax=Xaviernesmea oryzae TaxID=464029 RepID=A0A1Q9ARC1_9HYPH|nr:DUF1214 domain-containing protein [Xaviernesmea oryzae]OLP57982.1 hypothetical protein BJF93_14240 [Xaviernesmea oryzae]SEL27937.1 hypothetical protein SAMN04487976_10715 [Xaviernesmea oryzae]
MFRVPLLVALALSIAFGLGIASAVQALKTTVGFGVITLGPWTAYPNAQTSAADPYARAHRARQGRLLYGGAEGLQFIAATDSAGQPLDGRCRYDIVGQTPVARFWTLYMADAQDRAISAAPELPTALNAWTALHEAEGRILIHVSARAEPDNWLASKAAGPYRLVFTLLDTPTAGSSGLIEVTMPEIRQTGCGHA